MPDTYASALPRKRFFLEMFTRDISLHDCILDLIDNSIDGFIRTNNLRLSDTQVGSLHNGHSLPRKSVPDISVTLAPDYFEIEDTCGGIDYQHAVEEVFNFGHAADQALTDGGLPQLGAYGIGLKRALFKIGNHFSIDSHTKKDGFNVTVDVERWAAQDSRLQDWRFPLTRLPRANGSTKPGTRIRIDQLRHDIRSLISNETLLLFLRKAIATTYSVLLSHYITVTVNGVPIGPVDIPLAVTPSYQPAVASWTDDDVHIKLLAGLASQGDAREWRAEAAGWYVLCNGRVVLSADKSELTGWGTGVLPQFHSSKGRGFVGIAMFTSTSPLRLPWTTTKRSLNRESPVFLEARARMSTVARPVYSFLDSLYKAGRDDVSLSQTLLSRSRAATFDELTKYVNTNFKAPTRRRSKKSTTRIQFDATNSDLDLIRSHLRKPTLAASEIGKRTFEYFLDQEGLRA